MKFSNQTILNKHAFKVYILYFLLESLFFTCTYIAMIIQHYATSYAFTGLYDIQIMNVVDTVKPALRDHCYETTCLERSDIPGRRSYISIELNLSPKTTCLERPHIYGLWTGLSRRVLLYTCTHLWPYFDMTRAR